MYSGCLMLQLLCMLSLAAERANRMWQHLTGSSSSNLIGWLAASRGVATLELWLHHGRILVLFGFGCVKGHGYIRGVAMSGAWLPGTPNVETKSAPLYLTDPRNSLSAGFCIHGRVWEQVPPDTMV